MIEAVLVEVPNPGHPFGVRGVGEAPIIPPQAQTDEVGPDGVEPSSGPYKEPALTIELRASIPSVGPEGSNRARLPQGRRAQGGSFERISDYRTPPLSSLIGRRWTLLPPPYRLKVCCAAVTP